MGEIINTNTAIETQPGGDTGALLDITQSLLADARTALNSSGVLSVCSRKLDLPCRIPANLTSSWSILSSEGTTTCSKSMRRCLHSTKA